MLKYSVNELKANEAQNDERTNSRKRYELTLVPGQTILGTIETKEMSFFGSEVLEEIKERQGYVFQIALKDYDYASGRVCEAIAALFETTCPLCGHKRFLSNWNWDEYFDNETKSTVVDPAEAMAIQLTTNHSLDSEEIRRDSKRYTRIDKVSDGEGANFSGNALFVTLQAFIEGRGSSLVVRSPRDQENAISFCPGIKDPFDHPLIRSQDENTVIFGLPGKTYKTFCWCPNCLEFYYVILDPSPKDWESINRFQIEECVPSRLTADIEKRDDLLHLCIKDQNNKLAKEYQWNSKTGDFLVEGQSLAFAQDVHLDVLTILRPCPIQTIKNTYLVHGKETLDMRQVDLANTYAKNFPDSIPLFDEQAVKYNLEVLLSLKNIKAWRESSDPRSLLDTLVELSLANRFQGYPYEFFRAIWSKRETTEDSLARLVRIFYDCKELPVRFEDALRSVSNIQMPEREWDENGHPLPASTLKRILDRKSEIFDQYKG